MVSHFIAWDGEGITENGEHKYVLLANSTGNYIQNREGIRTKDALNFFWKTYRDFPKAKNVIFSGSYDANCILCDLTKEECALVWAGISVEYAGYEIIYHNRHEFTLEKNGKAFVLWDVWGFYQASFIKALEANVSDFDELDEIRSQKTRRSEFTIAEFDSILHYCRLELRGLVCLMLRLEGDLQRAEIGKLTAFHGAGSIAGSILKKEKIKHHIVDLPPAVDKAARFAYAGGRAELWKIGQHKGPFYTHDINSAYPYAATLLPSLELGEWEKSNYAESGFFSLFRVAFDSREKSARGYPLFLRLRTGNILYPPACEGWYWKPEIEAAYRAGFGANITIKEGWTFRQEIDVRPFNFIPTYFAKREALKLAGELGAQKVLKLGLNSLYGKLAQTLGGSEDRPPPFHCIAWAGFITSMTRAKVYEIAEQNPDAIAFIATDGIGATKKLNVPEGTGLGEWKITKYTRAMMVQAGVYFLWNGDELTEHYRGFDRGAITTEVIENGWATKQRAISIPSTRFISLGSALTGQRFKEWRQWRTIPRSLDLTGAGGKRELAGYPPMHKQLFPLDPTDFSALNGGGIPSSFAYPRKWLGEKWQELYVDKVPESVYEAELDLLD